jgi:hypothetical protein
MCVNFVAIAVPLQEELPLSEQFTFFFQDEIEKQYEKRNWNSISYQKFQ